MSEKTSVNETIHSGEPWCMESVHARFGKGRLETCPASGNALTAYFTFFVKIAPTGRIIWRLRKKDVQVRAEEEVTSL